MDRRLQLHDLLQTLIGARPDGKANVYFQPPSSSQLVYPCLLYQWTDVDTIFANDALYSQIRKYQVTIIDSNPDTDLPDKISQLSKCAFDRYFTADNLNHYVYDLYF